MTSHVLYDCFTFVDEFDILLTRLELLSPLVTRFVLVEASHTFSGKRKPLHFAEALYLNSTATEESRARSLSLDTFCRRIRPFVDRIEHVVVDNMPDLGCNQPDSRRKREAYQRDYIKVGLAQCAYDASSAALVGSVDELPDPEVVRSLLDSRFSSPTALAMRRFRCSLAWEEVGVQRPGTVLATVGKIRAEGVQRLRDTRHRMPAVPDAGWHLQWFDGGRDWRSRRVVPMEGSSLGALRGGGGAGSVDRVPGSPSSNGCAPGGKAEPPKEGGDGNAGNASEGGFGLEGFSTHLATPPEGVPDSFSSYWLAGGVLFYSPLVTPESLSLADEDRGDDDDDDSDGDDTDYHDGSHDDERSDSGSDREAISETDEEGKADQAEGGGGGEEEEEEQEQERGRARARASGEGKAKGKKREKEREKEKGQDEATIDGCGSFAARDPTVCAVVHLGQPALWGEMADYLDNLESVLRETGERCDVYVTIRADLHPTEEDLSEITATIHARHPRATTIVVENRGQDVGAWLVTMAHLFTRLDRVPAYKYVVKIHTKTDVDARCDFIAPLLGTEEDVRACLDTFAKRPDVGMIGAERCSLMSPPIDYLGSYVSRFGIPNSLAGGVPFVAGTMWWARFQVACLPFRDQNIVELFCEMTPGWVIDHTPAHVMERLFGFLVAKAGLGVHYAVPWVYASRTPLHEAQGYRPRKWAIDGSEGRVDRVFVLEHLARRYAARKEKRRHRARKRGGGGGGGSGCNGKDAEAGTRDARRKRGRPRANYLEISSPAAEMAPVSVDGVRLRVTSDGPEAGTCCIPKEYVLSCLRDGVRFGIAFVDGIHERSHVLKDVAFALSLLDEGGYVVLHDCLPNYPPAAAYPKPQDVGYWNGSVYKAVLELRCRRDLDCVVFDGDWGLCIVRKRRNPLPLTLPLPIPGARPQGVTVEGVPLGGGDAAIATQGETQEGVSGPKERTDGEGRRSRRKAKPDASEISWEAAFTNADANFRILKWKQVLVWLGEEDEDDDEDGGEGDEGKEDGHKHD